MRNRADAKRQAIADRQWQTVQEEDRQNEEPLTLSHQILDLTKADSRRDDPATKGIDGGRSSPARGDEAAPCDDRRNS
jgi:hypothetical protein